ncbi:hypothetical protein CPZ30_21640 [Paenibacillus lautus]|nr:hypothetical protein CPZ30_21640 [Paenibacillus lautus]
MISSTSFNATDIILIKREKLSNKRKTPIDVPSRRQTAYSIFFWRDQESKPSKFFLISNIKANQKILANLNHTKAAKHMKSV